MTLVRLLAAAAALVVQLCVYVPSCAVLTVRCRKSAIACSNCQWQYKFAGLLIKE
jgi:hypothetical protein